MSGDADQAYRTAAEWLSTASRVLVGAGAGLSVSAGIDYGDRADFARRFPGLVKRGVTARYQMIGRTDFSQAVFWGYWARHVDDVRFSARRAEVYEQLIDLVSDKDCFVLTSNVDAMFARHGFDPARVCAVQGDYAGMQCLRPCSPDVWPSRPAVERLLSAFDAAREEIADEDSIPRCPRCHGPVFFNVRAGGWFIEEPARPALQRLERWVGEHLGEPLVVIDVGSGFNTPTVVRWPLERLVARLPEARLIRINRDHPQVPPALGDRALAFGVDAAVAIASLRRERGDRQQASRSS